MSGACKQNIFIFIAIISISTLLQFKFINLNFNHFDTGIELHDTYKAFKHDFSHIFFGHVKLIKIIFFPLFLIDNIYIISYLYFFIQTTCILSPLFFFKNNIIKLIYILNPITSNFLFGDFHYDYLLIPIFFLVFYLSKKNKNYEFLSYFFILIKETFFIFPFILGIINFIETKNRNWLFLSICSLVTKLLFLNQIYNFSLGIGNIGIFNHPNIINYFSFNNYVFFLMLLINFILIRIDTKNKFAILSSIIIFFVYLIFSLNNQRLGAFSHYYLPFFLILFNFFCEKKLINHLKFKIITLIFLNIFSSISITSYFFWKTSPIKTYSSKSYVINFNNQTFKEVDFKNSSLMISNSFLIPETILSKNLYSLGINFKSIKDVNYIILSKKYISFDDKICFELVNCPIKDQYNNMLRYVKKNFQLDKEFENYIFFKKIIK